MAYRRIEGGQAPDCSDLSPEAISELLDGPYPGSGGAFPGDPSAFASPEARARAFLRHEKALTAEGYWRERPGCRPFGWWEGFHPGDPPAPGFTWEDARAEARGRGNPWSPGAVVLERLGELGDEEAAALKRRAEENRRGAAA